MTNKYNPIEYFKNMEREFTNEMVNDTLKYQKKYGFEIGNNNSAWNNESDAFRHAYMQAILSKRYSTIPALVAGYLHEKQGQNRGQDPREFNMDSWNNEQGRLIYNEIRREYPHFKSIPENLQKDIIAQKVVQKMKSGQLITHPSDSRKYMGISENIANSIKNIQETPLTPTRGIGGIKKNGVPLGFAAPIDSQNFEFSGYTNPLTGNNRIFTREEVGAMSSKEFAKYEKEIDAQLAAMGGTMPTNGDLQREAITGGGVIYVNSYTRSDGTQVRGYYRSR